MQTQIIERFLDTPAARKIAADIECEKETKRAAIRSRMTKLRREREKAVATAEPAFEQEKQRHQAALDAVPVARKAMQAAHTELSRARYLHAAELTKRQKELEAIA